MTRMAVAPLAVEVENVTKRYPVARRWTEALRAPFRRRHAEALRGVSLSLAAGRVHGLLGANGAGKTTLLKILATLVLPTSGRAAVQGHDVSRDAEAARAALGLVVNEERSFYWRLTGRQNLVFFASLHDLDGGRRGERVDELLAVVGLTADADRPFRTYSSGMRQRLAIARGLLAEPSVLLMDEPTRALDPPAAHWIRRFVRDELVAARGVSVVLATHDLLEAETTCDELTLIDEGRIVATGTVAELKRPLSGVRRTRMELLEPDEDLLAAIRARLPAATIDTTGSEDRAIVRVAGTPGEVAATVTLLVELGARLAVVRSEELPLATLFERVAARDDRGGATR